MRLRPPFTGPKRSGLAALSRAADDRATVALAGFTVTIAAAVMAGQFGRLLRRRSADLAPEQHVIAQAPAAARDTFGVALEGFAMASRRELVLFRLLSGFLGAFATVRLATWAIRSDRGPFRNVRIGGRHIHHFVPGILIAFGSGVLALLSEEPMERRLAAPFGVGMGLTFDEAALLLDLRDVYWSREGLISIQLSLATVATLGATILVMRILGRGERKQEEAGRIPTAPPYNRPHLPLPPMPH